MKTMKTCTKTNTHEMACKFVDMLYQQGTITAELYERFSEKSRMAIRNRHPKQLQQLQVY